MKTPKDKQPPDMEVWPIGEMLEMQSENWRTESGRTTTFQAFIDSLNESSVRKAKVKFGKEWGEEK